MQRQTNQNNGYVICPYDRARVWVEAESSMVRSTQTACLSFPEATALNLGRCARFLTLEASLKQKLHDIALPGHRG